MSQPGPQSTTVTPVLRDSDRSCFTLLAWGVFLYPILIGLVLIAVAARRLAHVHPHFPRIRTFALAAASIFSLLGFVSLGVLSQIWFGFPDVHLDEFFTRLIYLSVFFLLAFGVLFWVQLLWYLAGVIGDLARSQNNPELATSASMARFMLAVLTAGIVAYLLLWTAGAVIELPHLPRPTLVDLGNGYSLCVTYAPLIPFSENFFGLFAWLLVLPLDVAIIFLYAFMVVFSRRARNQLFPTPVPIRQSAPTSSPLLS